MRVGRPCEAARDPCTLLFKQTVGSYISSSTPVFPDFLVV